MEQAEIIALTHQTAPALVSDGSQLTQDFYQHLFTHNPALKHTFNMVNQVNGVQAGALLDAILLFVTKFDQLDTLGPQARMISAKHVSLDIQPGDYALVGASLLATIQAKLGDAATPAVMKAWELAYTRIAQVLSGLEEIAYQGHRTQPGGWNAFKPFTVTRVVAEAHNINSYILTPQDGQPLPTYLPGQFTSVAVQIPGQVYRQIRQYSLSDAPGRAYYRITVKRHEALADAPAGLVSTYLHEHVQAGDTLLVHAPSGEFYLDAHTDAPLVLLAGGVGITPLMAMLEHLAAVGSNREIILLQATHNPESHAFRQRLRILAKRYPRLRTFALYQNVPVGAGDSDGDDLDSDMGWGTGQLTDDHLTDLLADLSPAADFYCCGPLGFMRHVNGLLKARGFENRNFEVFGPSQSID